LSNLAGYQPWILRPAKSCGLGRSAKRPILALPRQAPECLDEIDEINGSNRGLATKVPIFVEISRATDVSSAGNGSFGSSGVVRRRPGE